MSHFSLFANRDTPHTNQESPFIKTDATMYTEVGFVGRDASEMIADLHKEACKMIRNMKRQSLDSDASPTSAEAYILDYLIGSNAPQDKMRQWLQLIRSGDLDSIEIPTQAVNLSGIVVRLFEKKSLAVAERLNQINLDSRMGNDAKKRPIREIRKQTIEQDEEQEDENAIAMEAKALIEERGIIVIDEIDKIVRDRSSFRNADASDEGVQRDLLPIVEGTIVPVKQSRGGPVIEVKTDYILFIAAGAFSHCKPADLLPEFQGISFR